MSRLQGIDRNVAIGTCMVVGCGGRAVWRQSNQTERGYCRAHKALAYKARWRTQGQTTANYLLDWLNWDRWSSIADTETVAARRDVLAGHARAQRGWTWTYEGLGPLWERPHNAQASDWSSTPPGENPRRAIGTNWDEERAALRRDRAEARLLARRERERDNLRRAVEDRSLDELRASIAESERQIAALTAGLTFRAEPVPPITRPRPASAFASFSVCGRCQAPLTSSLDVWPAQTYRRYTEAIGGPVYREAHEVATCPPCGAVIYARLAEEVEE